METQYIAAIGVGLLAGFINVFAGGGSLLTLPFLIFLGLPAPMANGTNRIALIMQNITATGSFKQLRVFRFGKAFILPCLPLPEPSPVPSWPPTWILH